MREIKFNIWDKKLKIFYSMDLSDGERLSEFAKWLENYPEYEVCQYTGLKDKNGKEIYEGDLIKLSIEGIMQAEPYKVENVWDLHIEINRDDSYYRIDEKSLEVIGNIYENPELLK